MERTSKLNRKTNETEILIELTIDGSGKAEIDSGIGFLDHMLTGFAKHGFFDLKLKAKGDLLVDGHHTAEDIGIVLGQAIRTAIGEKKGIKRYGSSTIPMDETLALCAIDLCGRPFLGYEAEFTVEKLGYLDTELIREFFYAVSYSAGMNLHLRILNKGNNHHMAEAMFKAFGRALDEATTVDARIVGQLSSKGKLE